MIHPRGLCGSGLGLGGGGVSAMLTRDHPGLNWFPQDFRNPGAALSNRPAGEVLRRDATSDQKLGQGSGAQQRCWGDRGCPKSAPDPSCSASLAYLFPAGPGPPTGWRPAPAQQASPSISPKTGVWRNAVASAASPRVPRSLQDTSRVLLQRPQPPTQSSSARCPGTPGGWGTLECAMPEVRAQV